MERLRKRKDITLNESEKRKQPANDETASQGSVISQLTSRIAALAGARSRAPSVGSISSALSFKSNGTAGTAEPKTGRTTMTDLDEKGTRFGKYRDIVEVDVLYIDGKDYTTNMSINETHKYICRIGLHIKRSRIHAVKTIWIGHPLVIIRLIDKIDIDCLPPNFMFDKETTNKKGELLTQKVVCEVRGTRILSEQQPRP